MTDSFSDAGAIYCINRILMPCRFVQNIVYAENINVNDSGVKIRFASL